MKKTNFTSKYVMETHGLVVIILITLATIFSQGKTYAQGFQTKKVADKITIISNPDIGDQVVIESEQGLVVFDSFWSEKTARLFKEEISKTLDRDDFTYVINMVDRLDRLGGNKAYQESVIVGHNNILTKYGNEKIVTSEITEMINMWRNKEELSRNRLEKYKKGLILYSPY